jgi:integrase
VKGSVYKRCTTCRTGVRSRKHREGCTGTRTSWAFVVDAGRDADGKRLRESRAGFATQKEADRALREVLAKVDGGTRVERSRVTVADYLRGEWLPATAPPRVGHGTHQKRTGHVETYIVPRIGGVPLQELNAAHVNRLYAELLTAGKVDGSALAASTCHDVHRTLRRALEDAVRWGLAEHNATDRADPPPVRAVEAERRRAMRVWTAAELGRFLSAIEGHRLHTLYEVASSTGLRRGELCGLCWRDVELDRTDDKGQPAPILTVRHRVALGPDGYVHEDATKSNHSARVVDLDARTVSLLRAHRVAQAAERLAAGPAWSDHDSVFADERGGWLSPPGVTQAFRRASLKVDVPRLTLHGLRHTHATLLLKAGVPLHVVSRRLGHASEAFTAAVYAHVLPGQQREAAETFSRLVFGGTGAGS